ncbi:MAG: DNA-processing protein DprA [Flavobacteriales bacterium]|nr:DNA-processing protein DprA [Flavobacteriales bacterium]
MFALEAQWIYRLALTFIPGIGSQSAKILLAYGGGEEGVFNLTKKQMMRIPGLARPVAHAFAEHRNSALKRAREEWTFLQSGEITPLFFMDEGYPSRLRHCPDCPLILYKSGPADLNAPMVLGVVGSRKATPYGLSICEQIIRDMASLDVLIVSGLALGIDVQAHRSALDHGLQTAAVLGHGLDLVYPAQHKHTAGRMKKQGALLSEYPSGSKPDRENFPKRNRIVAGMVDALLVIESGVKGGSIITASLAVDYARDVFAIPGRIGDEHSAGCHLLIKSNRAGLVENANDLMMAMNWNPHSEKAPRQMNIFPECNDDELLVLKFLEGSGELPVDELGARLKWTPSKTSTTLMGMEFKGLVRSLPGKRYRAIREHSLPG